MTFEYGDDGILTVQIHDVYAGQKKRFAIQQAGEDQMDAKQLIKLKRINEELVNKTMELENTPEFKDAMRGAEEDGAGRDPADREPRGPPRAGGPVPAGARRPWAPAIARKWKKPAPRSTIGC